MFLKLEGALESHGGRVGTLAGRPVSASEAEHWPVKLLRDVDAAGQSSVTL